MSNSGELKRYVPNLLPMQNPFPRLASQLERAKRGDSRHSVEDIERLIEFHRSRIRALETRWQEIDHHAVEHLLTNPVEAFRGPTSLPTVSDVVDWLKLTGSPLLSRDALTIRVGDGAIAFGTKQRTEIVLSNGEWIGTDDADVFDWRHVERLGPKGSIPPDVFEAARIWWRVGHNGPSAVGGRPRSDGTGDLRTEVLMRAIRAYVDEHGAVPDKQEPFSRWLVDHLHLSYAYTSVPKTVARAIEATGLSFGELVSVALSIEGSWSMTHIED